MQLDNCIDPQYFIEFPRMNPDAKLKFHDRENTVLGIHVISITWNLIEGSSFIVGTNMDLFL